MSPHGLGGSPAQGSVMHILNYTKHKSSKGSGDAMSTEHLDIESVADTNSYHIYQHPLLDAMRSR